MKYFITLLIAFGLLSTTFAQDSLKVEFSPYASFRGHFAFYNDEVEIQENASRIGFELSVYKGKARFFVGSEFGVNLFRSPQIFNTDANASSGFIRVTTEELNVFTTRLGYLGVDLGKGGIFTLGKQWSTFYDVTGYTDKFNVYGGRGSATYTGSSDGGETGTGRAAQAVSYRNSFGNLTVGGMVQFRSTTNDRFVDGYGLSAQYEILPGLRAGAAYNRAYFDEDIIENTNGFGGQPEYLSFGMSYKDDHWDVGVVYVNQNNGDVTLSELNDELISSVYDADGLEVFIKYMQPRFAIIAGYNGYNPDVNNLPLNSEFERQDFIIGGEFKPSRFAYFYTEYRISTGKTGLGLNDEDVFTLGIRLDLNRTYSRYIK